MKYMEDPPDSYITEQDGVFYKVTEFNDEDLKICIEYESTATKLGYLTVLHAITLDQRLSHGAFRLYCLYHYWSQRKSVAWPSLRTLADHLGVSKSSIVAYNKELEDAGYIARHGRCTRDRNGKDRQLTSLVIIKDATQNPGATQLAAKILTEERGMKLVGGGQPADQGGQPVGHEELTIEGVTIEGEAPAPRVEKKAAETHPLLIEEDYIVTLYYKDKSAVRKMGTVEGGPWSVTCECGADVVIHKLETPVLCTNASCQMHEFVLTKQRREQPVKTHPAVLLAIKKLGATSLNDEGKKLIADCVAADDLEFWEKVMSSWLQHGWNRRNVAGMVDWYNRREIPSTGKKKGSVGQDVQLRAEKRIIKQKDGTEREVEFVRMPQNGGNTR